MKTLKILLVVFVLNAVLGIAYYSIDKELAYYGKNSLKTHQTLPLKIAPDFRYDFEGGFALRDKYGFTIAAKGNTYLYNGNYITINSVLCYCFDKNKVLVHIIDSIGDEYYVSFSENNDVLSKRQLTVNVYNKAEFVDDGKCKWVFIKAKDKNIDRLVLIRNFDGLILVALTAATILFSILRYMRNKRKAKFI